MIEFVATAVVPLPPAAPMESSLMGTFLFSVPALLGSLGLAVVIVALVQRDRVLLGSAGRVLRRRLGITRQQRKLLECVSSVIPELPASTLLISPGCFDTASARFVEAGGTGQLDEIDRLRRQIFGAGCSATLRPGDDT